MKTRTPRQLALAASVSAAVLLTAGCGDGPSDDSSAGSGAAVDVAAAQESIAPLLSPPTEFSVTEPLEALPEPGTVVAFLDNGTPTAASMYANLSEAAEVLGVTMQRVRTGQSPQDVNAALNTVVETKPAAVVDLAVDPALFAPQLEELQEAGTAFVPMAIVDGAEYGFDDAQIQSGATAAVGNGGTLASALLAETEGKATDLVFYRVPELNFTPLEQQGVEERLAEQCPDCTLRVVDISITEVGSTAPRTIVSDLQAHPETQAFIASIDDLQMGLPAAMDVAGMDVPGIGIASNPVNFQQIAAGQQLAGLATDLHFVAWLLMDQVARELAGQDADYSEFGKAAGPETNQIITKDNVPSDPEAGYISFPDYAERFTQLWTGQ